MICEVADPDDPRIEAYRAVRERDLAGRHGLFVAEGRVVLEKLVGGARHRLRSVLIARPKLTGMADVLSRLAEDVPVYVAEPAVMDAIAGFPIHRGVLAVGERRPLTAAQVLGALPAKALVVGLAGIANHDNMGGVFRNAAAFGADAVLLDPACCDPLYRKAIRVSVGAALLLPFAQLAPGEDLAEVLAGAGFEVLALSPSGERELGEVTPAARTAALFGAEGPGLSAELMARATTVRIAMAGGFDSLNVATTSGIVLHHLARGAQAPKA